MFTTFNPYKLFTGAFIPEWLMSLKNLSASDKLVWAYLAKCAGQKGFCWPEQKKIAERCGMSERTVVTSIGKLSELNFIKVTKATGTERWNHKGNVYEFLCNEVIQDELIKAGLSFTSASAEIAPPASAEIAPPYIEKKKEEKSKSICPSNSNSNISEDNLKIISALERISKKHYPNNNLSANHKLAWNKSINKLLNNWSGSTDELLSMLKHYYIHFDKTDKYHPVIRSGESLCEKIDKLERFCTAKQQNNKTTEMSLHPSKCKAETNKFSNKSSTTYEGD